MAKCDSLLVLETRAGGPERVKGMLQENMYLRCFTFVRKASTTI